MGFFYTDNDPKRPTEELREYRRLQTRKSILEEELSLYQIRQQVKDLEQQVHSARKQHDNNQTSCLGNAQAGTKSPAGVLEATRSWSGGDNS